MRRFAFALLAATAFASIPAVVQPVIAAPPEATALSTPVTHHVTQAGTARVFYREAGPTGAPVVLLLHGFPASSHQFRNLIPALADRYHVIAPDLPGFGFTEAPPRAEFGYTFEHLTDVIEAFTETLGLKNYAIYVFDYGAPVGFRLALRHPERISAIISQNGNAYEDGLSAAWNPIQTYWQHPTDANRAALKGLLTPETTRWQYEYGEPDATVVDPESYTLDAALLSRPGNADIQLDLFLDYTSNVALYPKFHEFFRDRRAPTLAIWGKNDPFFLPAGAEAFKRDNPAAEVRFLEAGHFAGDNHPAEIAAAVRDFLGRTLKPAQ